MINCEVFAINFNIHKYSFLFLKNKFLRNIGLLREKQYSHVQDNILLEMIGITSILLPEQDIITWFSCKDYYNLIKPLILPCQSRRLSLAFPLFWKINYFYTFILVHF